MATKRSSGQATAKRSNKVQTTQIPINSTLTHSLGKKLGIELAATSVGCWWPAPLMDDGTGMARVHDPSLALRVSRGDERFPGSENLQPFVLTPVSLWSEDASADAQRKQPHGVPAVGSWIGQPRQAGTRGKNGELWTYPYLNYSPGCVSSRFRGPLAWSGPCACSPS